MVYGYLINKPKDVIGYIEDAGPTTLDELIDRKNCIAPADLVHSFCKKLVASEKLIFENGKYSKPGYIMRCE